MSREILFKAKRKDNNNWIEGDLINFQAISVGLMKTTEHFDEGRVDNYYQIEVIPSSICQFTGQYDVKGNRIFEGDKFNDDFDCNGYLLVEWNEEKSGFCINLYSYGITYNEGGSEVYDDEISLVDINCMDVLDVISEEIIGNIHD